jgi:hypothetical protein
MKQTFLILVAIVSLATFSCKKDKNDGNTNDNLPALDANKVTDWLQVEGATKRTGNPPAPNGATAPKISIKDNKATGIVDVGFFGSFGTEGTYTGAYVKVKGADKYLDINLSSSAARKAKQARLGKNQRTREVDELDIFFGLSDESVIGTFCYEICLYDEAGQVSNIVEICVTVNNVGGNDQLVGKWQYSIIQEYNANGQLDDDEIVVYGEEYYEGCGVYYDVELGQYTHSDSFRVKFYSWIELLSNGNYSDNYKDVLQGSIPSSCPEYSNSYQNNESYELYVGKWSYNPSTNKVIIITQKECSYCGSSKQEEEIYDTPRIVVDGELVSVNNTTLVLKDTDLDGSYTIYTFKKF